MRHKTIIWVILMAASLVLPVLLAIALFWPHMLGSLVDGGATPVQAVPAEAALPGFNQQHPNAPLPNDEIDTGEEEWNIAAEEESDMAMDDGESTDDEADAATDDEDS